MLYIKRIAILFAGAMITVFCVGFAACIKKDSVNYFDREAGNFIVRFYNDYCEIKGTTAQGNKNRFLIIPSYIDGIKVKSLGYVSLGGAIDMVAGELTFPDIKSKIVEKVYLESGIEMYPFSFQSCPNLEKIMSPQVFPCDYSISYDIYYPADVYESIIADGSYFVNRFPANISYYYNYERLDGARCYWIDDCDYGSKIEFIPPEPEREGYTFGGWYKEPECINKWNFETDVLPEERTQINGDGKKTVCQETKLYAKWTGS